MVQMKLWIGSNKINLTIGDNVTNVTNQNIANNLVDKVAELLNAKSVRHFYCSDKTTTHEQIVIEYNHKKK